MTKQSILRFRKRRERVFSKKRVKIFRGFLGKKLILKEHAQGKEKSEGNFLEAYEEFMRKWRKNT